MRAAIACFLLALAFAGSPAPAVAQASVEPADGAAVQDVIGGQIEAFRRQDDAAAYGFAAPNVRQVFPTLDSFMAMVRQGYEPLRSPESYVFGRNVLVEDSVHQEVLVTDATGKQWQAVYTLRRQSDGSWKVTGVKLNPHQGVGA